MKSLTGKVFMNVQPSMTLNDSHNNTMNHARDESHAFFALSEMTLVEDEFNRPHGVVTFNDILKAMHGDIFAVRAPPKPAAMRREDGTWLMDVFVPVDQSPQDGWLRANWLWLAMVRITEAVLMNQHGVLPVGTLLRGEYGIRDVSLPGLRGGSKRHRPRTGEFPGRK